jgi:hypothetical protein
MVVDNLIADLQEQFSNIKDHRSSLNQKIALKDVLLSGFALFSLKDSSLLEYIHQYKTRQSNLKTVYGIQKCPSDTAMRQILDEVEPSQLQELPSRYIQLLDEEGCLSPFELKGEHLSNHLLIPLDGTQYYCSKKVGCPCCLTKKHKDGTMTYHHNALSAVIVHPNLSEVLVVATEDIQIQDGKTKNDHELQAAIRLMPLIRRGIGERKAILGGDSLFANAPFIRLAHHFNFNFLLSIKEGYQGYPFIQFNELSKAQKTTKYSNKDKKYQYHYEFANNLCLNGQNQDIEVNFMRFQQIDLQSGEILTMTWITDIPITTQNCSIIVKAGRARWKIENETFNTLKNQGYQYEHNFGHGQKHLAQNFAQLMFLAFLFDQIQQLLDKLFSKALNTCSTKKLLWLRVRQIFDLLPVNDMETIFKIITKDIKLKIELLS